MRRMLITLMVLVVAKKSRTFSVSHVQLMSRWAGAGREQSQAASPSWPVEIFHTIDAMLSSVTAAQEQAAQLVIGW